MKLYAIIAYLLLAGVTLAGEREVATLSGEVEEMRLHVRSSCPHFWVCFENDSLNSVSIVVNNLDKSAGAYDYLSAVNVSDNSVDKNGVPVTNLLCAKVNHKSDEFSVCVEVDDAGTCLLTGDGTRILDGDVCLHLNKGTKIIVSPELKSTDYVQFDVRYKPGRQRAAFDDMRALHDHLSTSADSLECLWQWVDCETEAPAVTAGGRYTLATVTNNSDGYDIVYINGAQIGEWQPLDIKGHLAPSPFEGQFDVTWYDSAGHDTGEGVYATITPDGLMTLTFTPLHSRLRLIKRP